MNFPETPGTLNPAIDPGLRELYGTADKDLSRAAAARRAAHRDAMAAKLPASRGPPAERAAALARANPAPRWWRALKGISSMRLIHDHDHQASCVA